MGKTYRNPRRHILPKRSRTIPLFGTGDDAGKYYRCWNCGFICNAERDTLGDGNSYGGDNHTDFANLCGGPVTHNYGGKALFTAQKACLGGDINHYHTAVELGCHSIPELVTNGSFSNWVNNFPVGWVQYGTPDSTNYVTEDNESLRVVRTDNVSGVYQNVLSANEVNKRMRVSFEIKKSVSGTITIEQGTTNFLTSEAGVSDVGTYTYYHTPTNTLGYLIGATNGTDISVKNFSVQCATPRSTGHKRVPRTVRHDLTSDVTSGCPFCGSTNWRGDY